MRRLVTVCAVLLAIAALALIIGAAPAKADTITGPVMTPRYWAQHCQRQTLGLRGEQLAAWHRWCAGIQPKRQGH